MEGGRGGRGGVRGWNDFVDFNFLCDWFVVNVLVVCFCCASVLF